MFLNPLTESNVRFELLLKLLIRKKNMRNLSFSPNILWSKPPGLPGSSCSNWRAFVPAPSPRIPMPRNHLYTLQVASYLPESFNRYFRTLALFPWLQGFRLRSSCARSSCNPFSWAWFLSRPQLAEQKGFSSLARRFSSKGWNILSIGYRTLPSFIAWIRTIWTMTHDVL